MKLLEKILARQGLLLIIVAALTLEATGIIQYYFAGKGIREEANHKAQSQLQLTNLEITNIMDQVETAVENNLWAARRTLPYPDSLYLMTGRLVKNNPIIMGSAVALKPDFYPEKGRLFAPYSYMENGELLHKQLGTEEYDYLSAEWYTKPLELDDGYWSEPYFDEGGGNIPMTTYSIPLKDREKRVVGVLTADVSLDWLTDKVGTPDAYKKAFAMLLSRSGRIMVCPIDSLSMRATIQGITSSLDDTMSLSEANKAMLSGETGNKTFTYHNKVCHMFFAPVERSGWIMSIIIPRDEIYAGLKQVGLLVKILQLLGIAMIILIMHSAFKNQKKLNSITENKNRIESELHVASGIQMSMLPKTFPSYPERSDIDMFASLVPAKEVGGDLYDFYIRDERLFFCIGDVSGKGVPASLVMAVTRSLFRTVSAHEKSPQRIVTAMNESMSEMNESNMFVTFFCGVLDLGNGHLRYCNAGHNAPFLGTAHSTHPLEVIPNLPLGIMPGMSFQEQETDLSCGDSLFLYTDGLTEAENIDHTLFGDDRIPALLDVRQTARVQLETISKAVSEFVGEAPQSDDLTMLCIRFTNKVVPEEYERHLILHNDIQQIPQLADFVETIAEIAHLEQPLAMNLNLALEEAVSNVILYAYPQGSDGLVDVEAIIRKDQLDLVITDNGTPFDPTAVADADITLGVEERAIGGLGIFLVRNIMDKVSYRRDDGKNILSMTKKI